MSYRLLLAVACAGCTESSTVTVEELGTVGKVLVLDPDTQDAEPNAEYRWKLAHAPDASTVALVSGQPATAFTPDQRGDYVVERWLVYGVGEELTHRYIVDVTGIRPVPIAEGPSTANVGSSVALSAAASSSIEGRSLAYAWRLRMRPRDSGAQLDGAESVAASFVPDIVGIYEIELAVFDGELWSEPADLLVLEAVAP